VTETSLASTLDTITDTETGFAIYTLHNWKPRFNKERNFGRG